MSIYCTFREDVGEGESVVQEKPPGSGRGLEWYNDFYIRVTTCNFSFHTNSKVKITVKILSTSGKAKDEIVSFAGYGSDEEQCSGPVFPEVKTSKLKKNKTFSSTCLSNFRSGMVYFILPEGMDKVKIKVTFSSVEGKK